MEIKEIKAFLETGAGKAMKEYLELRLKSLLSIERVKDIESPTHQAIELKAQKKAYLLLRDILDDIMIVERAQEREEKPEEDNLVPGIE